MNSIWSRHYQAISVSLIAIVVVVIYGQTAWFGLVTYDDPHFVGLNKMVLDGLSKETFVWSFTTTDLGIWHPITWLSYQLESTLFGAENDTARHLHNMVLHFANSLLVWLLMRSLGLGRLTALFIALVWAVHPQHVQVVAWISERKELLATCFGLGALWCYIAWWQDNRQYKYALSIIAFMLAIASKPSIVPLCLIIPFYSLTHLSGHSIKRVMYSSVPFIILALVISVSTIQLKTNGKIESALTNDQYTMDVSLWLALIPKGLAHYLSSFVWPWPLPVMITTPKVVSFWDAAKNFMVVAVFLFMSIYLSLKNSTACFGFVWFILFWLPVSGLISLGAFYVADRYMYLPHIGLIILFVELGRLLAKR